MRIEQSCSGSSFFALAFYTTLPISYALRLKNALISIAATVNKVIMKRIGKTAHEGALPDIAIKIKPKVIPIIMPSEVIASASR